MATTEFFKVYGAEKRADVLICLSATNYLLIFGYGKDADGNGFTWRKYYNHKPTKAELRADINALINLQVDTAILSGMHWNGKPVWLSTENQLNFKAAYDIAVQTDGASLPIKFKLGENADGEPVYHTFTKLEPFKDFILSAFAYIKQSIDEGWAEKDAVNYDTLLSVE